MKKLISIFLFLPVFSFAQTEWEYVGTDNAKSEYYVKDYYKKEYSEYIFTWLKVVHPDKFVRTKKGTVKKNGTISMQKWKFNCSEKTMALVSYAEYLDGNLIKSGEGLENNTDVVPESIGESLLNYLCSKF